MVGSRSFAVKGFGALYNNIYDCLFTTLDLPANLDGEFSIKIIVLYS
jgi:hypothetical protein